MIKYFRKIRQNLLLESKTGKYLKYAIGEIILVVIGILIALQINTWNEERINKNKETKILTVLLSDFQETIENLKEALDYYPYLVKRLETQINYIGYDKDFFSQEMKDTLSGIFFPNTKIIQGSLQIILSSENLQLITNEKLKSLLTAYPSHIESFKEQELESKKIVLNEHRPILEKYFSLTDFVAENEKKFPDLKERSIPSDFKGLINDHGFQNILVKEIYHIQFTENEAKGLLAKTIEITELINQSLKTKG
jgi:hypothetical protein